jgi:hypothetical protein
MLPSASAIGPVRTTVTAVSATRRSSATVSATRSASFFQIGRASSTSQTMFAAGMNALM